MKIIHEGIEKGIIIAIYKTDTADGYNFQELTLVSIPKQL